MRFPFPPVLAYVFFQATLLLSPACDAEDYVLGQGLHEGNYFLSGYVNLEAVDRFDTPSKLDLDDLSVFAGGNLNRWTNPFIEAEFSKHTLIRQGGDPQHGDFVVERFYNDILLADQDTLRIGKMLTPLGDWNQVHAAPLIPLITRPYTTALGFDAYASGVSWIHEGEDLTHPGLQLYWQPDAEFFKRPLSQTNRNFRHVYGAHVNAPMGLLDKVGASIQHGELIETGETYSLVGANANQSFGKLKLIGEALTSQFSGTVLPGAAPRIHSGEAGIFVLAEYAITPQWHGILASEHYQDHLVDGTSRSSTLAVTYKPDMPMVFKIEYIHQAGISSSIAQIHTGLKASFSTLF